MKKITLLLFAILTFTFFNVNAQYCDSTPSSNDGTGIAELVVGTTTFTSGGDITYEDFTGSPVELQAGVQANVQITFATGYTYDTHIWVDFGDDDSFAETGDLVYSGVSLSANPTTLDASFNIPSDAVLGTHRMRIGTADSGQLTPNPCYTGSYGVTMDVDITIVAAPACLPPTDLSASNIATDGADLSWTESGTAAAWNVEVVDVTAGGTATGTATHAGATNPITVSGLTANNNYAYYVQADCSGDLSDWAGPFAFTTLCDALTVPFTEGFNSDSTTEACWTVLDENADGDLWNMDYTSNSYEGDQSAMMYTDFNSGNNDDWLISPQITLTGNERLKFQYRVQSSSEPNDFEVLLSTTANGPDAFTNTLLASADYSNITYAEQIIDLSSYSGNVYIAWHVPNGGLDGWRLYIDEVIVEEIPSCAEPNTLTASATSTTEATVTWVAGGAETDWTYEYGVTGFTQGTGTTGTVATTPSLDLTGLTAGETYDIYIQTNCSGSDSIFVSTSWNQPNEGDTCDAPIVIATLPYNTTDDTANYGDDYTGSPGASGCGTTSSYLGGDDVVYSYTAAVDGSINVALSSMGGTYYGIFVYTDCADIGTSCIAGYASGSSSADYDFDLAVTTGTTYYFVISTWPSPQSTTYTLDITELSCATPSDLSATNITATSADISWTENGTSTNWHIEVVDITAGGTATGTATVSDVTIPYTLSGLTPNNDYEFYVLSDCDSAGLSNWAGPFAFSTPCEIITPDYTQNFDTFVPDCWDEAESGTPATGPTGLGSGSWGADGWLNSGTTGAARINLYSNTKEEWMLSPHFDLSAGGYELVYSVGLTDYANTNPPEGNGMGSDDEVQVLISSDNGTTWTALTTYNQSSYPSHTGDVETIDLTAYDGSTVQFAFWATEGSVNDSEDYDFFIDDFIVRTPLACVPASVVYSEVSDCDNSGGFLIDVEITDMGSATNITVSDNQGSATQAVTMASTVQFGPYVNGTNVVITVSDDADSSCDQSSSALTQTCPPANDDIASAIAITVDEGFCDGTNTNGTNEAATDSMEANGSCFNGTSPTDDVWFTFTVPVGTATVDVSTDFTGGTLIDSEIALYSGTPGSLVEIACDQDSGTTTLSNGFDWNSLISDVAVTVGETYYVQVAGYGSGTTQGTFCLDVSTNQVLSLEDNVFAGFEYFPNPVNDVLSLRAQQSIQHVSVFNMLGQEVVRIAPNVLDADVDMTVLQAGTYFVQVTINDATETIKVIRK